MAPLLIGAAGSLHSQTSHPPALPPSHPGSDLTISLMTMGVGAQVWERFGHNAIVVEDRRQGSSIAYNYGMFSFRQESFLLRFIQGRMMYWMMGIPTEDDVPRYVAARRSVWRQELNLTPEQRQALRDFLIWNARPENKFYAYDYYLDNCSTRVRDALDRILGGALRQQSQQPAEGTYRFHTLRLNSTNRVIYTGLLVGEGHPADAPVTHWDEMFLPLKLREYLRDVRVLDSSGAAIPLVTREETVFESSAFPVPTAPPDWIPGFLVVGVVLGGVMLWAGISAQRGGSGRWLLVWLGTLWVLVSGLAGVMLAGLWAFTAHWVASRNENVLQFNLLALLLALLLPLALGRRRRAIPAARGLVTVVAALSLAGLILQLLPGFDQVNGQVLALSVPANLGMALGVLAATRTPPDRAS